MTSTVFGILSDPAIGERLHKELKKAFPDPSEGLSFVKLEAIPYLVIALTSVGWSTKYLLIVISERRHQRRNAEISWAHSPPAQIDSFRRNQLWSISYPQRSK